MAQRHRLLEPHGAEAAVLEIMQVRATDATKGHAHLQLARSGLFFVQRIHAQVFGGVTDHGFHGMSLSIRVWQ